MPTLHPAVDRLLNSGKYVCIPKVEGFTTHELKDRTGKVIRQVTKEDLEETAKVNNQKAANGALTPVGPGHTYDDEYDDKGKLVRKFPEEKQPKPFGYLYNYRVELNPHTGKYALYHDEYIQRAILDPETGKMIDGVQYASTFPRRSAEIYHSEHWIDWMAAIRRAPRLDLGLSLYAKSAPDHTSYARSPDGSDAPVLIMGRDKTRYSFDTGGSMDPEPKAADPTAPPSAAPPAAPAAPAAGAGGQGPMTGELEPMHREAADAYARHASGMHGSQFKKLMGHLHQKYAAECGLPGDMNMEYAMGGPSNVAPVVGATPPPAVSPTAPSGAPQPPKPPEHNKMSHDQAAIEKERYEKRLADLEARAASAEASALKSYYERELLQLVHEGFEIKAADELDFVEKRKYSREQFDDHVSILRRAVQRAPISDGAPIDRDSYTLRKPIGEPTREDKLGRDFDKIQRYMRSHECSWEEACERYEKPNGVAAK